MKDTLADLISSLGLKPKKIAEILNISTSFTYDKLKGSKGARFTELEAKEIKKHLTTKLKKIK